MLRICLYLIANTDLLNTIYSTWPKEITISASHAADTTHAGETLHLVQIDRAEHLWVDQYGYQWMIIGNTVRQITVPEYLVPNDNTYGTLHGPDRNHPEFASSVYA